MSKSTDTNAIKINNKKISDRLWSTKAKILDPYIPGEQPKHDDLCKLNTNENPFPPSPKVAHAINSVLANQATSLRLYPNPESDDLRESIAMTLGLSSNQVFVGNGSDEVLALVFASFFMQDGSEIAKQNPLFTPDIGYSFYPVYGNTFNVELNQIPLADDFSVNVDDYIDNEMNCGGIIIANPNAPTGMLLSLDDVEKLCQNRPNSVVVIDEAYIDFAVIDGKSGCNQSGKAIASAVNLIDKYDNLLVTQTFSKSRSLAGLRVGMAFGNPSLMEALTRMKNSFNSYPLDKLAQAGAMASLHDGDYFNTVCQKVIRLRDELVQELTLLEFEVLESHANFVFAKPTDSFFKSCNTDEENFATDGKSNVEQLISILREEGIIVRHFDKPRINEYLRISIGTKEQNKRLVKALQTIAKPLQNQQNMNNDMNKKSHSRDDLRFFLKCYDTNADLFKTYRFDNQDELANFAKLSSKNGMTIIDTHITFFDVALVFAAIPENNAIITPNDVDMAEDGCWYLKEWG